MAQIRTTHVGSLIRPPLVIERMRAVENREPFDEAAFETELTTAVREVVEHQVRIGIDVPSDGEFGKRGWTQYVAERLTGFSQDVNRPSRTVTSTAPDTDRFGDFYREHAESATASATSSRHSPRPVEWTGSCPSSRRCQSPRHAQTSCCWGSQNHPHVSDLPLRELVDSILVVNAGAYLIEAANPRHEWEWTVWQDVKLPSDKVLVPGVP